jgi:hypothetical protein
LASFGAVELASFGALPLVPTLRVGMPSPTLRVVLDRPDHHQLRSARGRFGSFGAVELASFDAVESASFGAPM